MEVRKPVIKSIPYGEFKDNETLEKLTAELNEGGANVGAKQLALVADFRNELLRYRVHGCGLRPL